MLVRVCFPRTNNQQADGVYGVKKTNISMLFSAGTDQSPSQSLDTELIKKNPDKLTIANTIHLCLYEEGKLVGSLTLPCNVIIKHVFKLWLFCQMLYQMVDSELHSDCLILIFQSLQFHIFPTDNQRPKELILSSPLTANILI